MLRAYSFANFLVEDTANAEIAIPNNSGSDLAVDSSH
jgi:hypothetical protein